MTSLRVLRPGLHTTVQDLGRRGFSHAGVPVAGALDPAALASANAAVGNHPGAAGLECVLRGPTLVPGASAVFSVVGAGWVRGPEVCPAGSSYDVGPLPEGLRCWVAVGGGIEVPMVLGSRSTDTVNGLGGQPLRAGDELPVGHPSGATTAARPAPPPPAGETVLRYLSGPQVAAAVDDRVWQVATASDRTALRLRGPALPSAAAIATIGVLPGTVQLPPGGQPIVLLANCQTTGGYPVIGVVVPVDLRLAAQLRPGSPVRLAAVSLAEARALVQAAD